MARRNTQDPATSGDNLVADPGQATTTALSNERKVPPSDLPSQWGLATLKKAFTALVHADHTLADAAHKLIVQAVGHVLRGGKGGSFSGDTSILLHLLNEPFKGINRQELIFWARSYFSKATPNNIHGFDLFRFEMKGGTVKGIKLAKGWNTDEAITGALTKLEEANKTPFHVLAKPNRDRPLVILTPLDFHANVTNFRKRIEKAASGEADKVEYRGDATPAQITAALDAAEKAYARSLGLVKEYEIKVAEAA